LLERFEDDITAELIKRLQVDEAALEKFYQFFGLNMGGQYPLKDRFPLKEIKKNVSRYCCQRVKRVF